MKLRKGLYLKVFFNNKTQKIHRLIKLKYFTAIIMPYLY